ncbi:DNA-directed RNA polymerase subunit alpha [Candidatus Peregrinibacteria bacterium]|jgi:DNA-directed RNA polymerase subunit alpha|nr:DNA-directed RNA polymerase subunit alpha [Candidatus Peregrinibacteria bacterium]MBT4147748.1 DNA-directed RNA polymerase subunit alpha [Candidatus Peregrinibacteria bacterium]MBT4365941.1 DNA-directed RNA polymerase subunit alpha [Candidatus Peregrinibacteria bacterium]MBT4456566.1 DNA-directed RNA polymerase subunit alpha [Candidatus Peregrinibacteria bacterium]
MHIIQEEIGIPKIKTDIISKFHVVFTMSPLPTGYGMTIGNALRRSLLSSLPGAAVTGVKIDGVTHEYSTIPGVKDSVLDITLNLKLLDIKKTSKEPSKLKLEVSKAGKITAKDIQCPSDVEIMNPDLYITTLEKGSKLKMELRVEKGVGYIPANQKQKEEDDTSMIVIDAVYSPVKKVRFEVEATRVGQMTELDKLTLEILTNGTISPEDALKFSSNILKSYFDLFNIENIMVEDEFMSDLKSIVQKEKEEEAKKPQQESYTPIEILGFSPRTLNALINGGIGSIEQLSKCTESKLSNLRGFGKKALNEVKDALEKKNLTLSEE